MQPSRQAGRRSGDPSRRGQDRTDRSRRTLLLAGVALVAAVLLGALAKTIVEADASGRRSLEDRAVQRTVIAQHFIEAIDGDLQASIEAHATAALASPQPTAEQFDQVNQMMRFRAAVLLDERGHVIQAYPDDPALVGEDLSARYDHLRRAVAGEAVISGVVPSAVKGEPIVAFAVPFDTPEGRRVFSAGYRVEDTPLGAYLQNATVLPGEAVYLVDGTGTIIASSDDDADGPATFDERRPDLAEVAAAGHGTTDDGTWFVTTQSIDGAPWRLIRVLPTEAMYGPAEEGRWIPWILFGGFVVVGAASLLMLGSIIDQRDRERRRARRDPLTGLANRRSLDAALAARRDDPDDAPWAVLMIDVDHFKAINDRHGHRRGDEVLAMVADTIATSVRPGDLAGRWGGEEFMVVVPDAALAVAGTLAERIRSAVAAADADGIRATVSVGYASSSAAPADGLVDLADASLYRAKQDGRDRCVTLAPAEAFPSLATEPV